MPRRRWDDSDIWLIDADRTLPAYPVLFESQFSKLVPARTVFAP